MGPFLAFDFISLAGGKGRFRRVEMNNVKPFAAPF